MDPTAFVVTLPLMPRPFRNARRGLLAGAVGLLAARTARASANSWQFAIEEVELEVAGLHPAHDGLVVAQLSDLHIGMHTPDGRIIAAVDAVNRRKPDLVVLTGDYVTRRGDPLERVPELLSRLNGPVMAVLGNHDHWTDAPTLTRDLKRIGIEVLANQHTVTRLRGAAMTVLGVDDAVSRHADVAATFRGAATQGTRLVLAHAPPTINALPQQQGLLCLSGHTHGGQMYFGRVTEAMFKRAGQPFVRGRYDVGGNTLYVNRGLGFGNGGPLPRVASDPEVTFLTLRAPA